VDILQAEDEAMAEDSVFGRALQLVLKDALPIVRSDLNLSGWLHELSQETEPEHASAAAELYLRLSRGWFVLPPGTRIDPQHTRNYLSATCAEAEPDVTAEIKRLHSKGFLLTWEEVRERYPSLKDQERPTIILAMGCIIKQTNDKRKVRLVLDASAPHDGTSLNAQIDVPATRLASVRKARAGLAELSRADGELWGFSLDFVDAYLQNPCSEETISFLGIEWQGKLYAYPRMPFGVASAPAAQMTMSCAFMRAVMRRWARAGFVCGPVPGYDHKQAWPGAAPTTSLQSILRTGAGYSDCDGVSWAADLTSEMTAPESDRSSPYGAEWSASGDDTESLRLSGKVFRARKSQRVEPELSRDPEPLRQPVTPATVSLPVGPKGPAPAQSFAPGLGSARPSLPSQRVKEAARDRDKTDPCHRSGSTGAPAADANLWGYLDDFYGQIRGSKARADRAYEICRETCADLGLIVQEDPLKTSPPSKITLFLGLEWDLEKMEIRLTTERVAKLVQRLTDLEGRADVTLKELQSIVGVLQFCSVVLPAAVPFYRQLLDAQRGMGKRSGTNRKFRMTAEMQADIAMWLTLLRRLNGRPITMGITQPVASVRLWTDASLTGYGTWFGGRQQRGRWPTAWYSRMKEAGGWEISINHCEACALLIGLRDVIPLVAGKQLRCMIDNQAVIGMCRKLSARSAHTLPIFKEIAILCSIYAVSLRPIFVPSEDNKAADMLSRTWDKGVTEAEVQVVLSRWRTREPDATWWFKKRPERPDLFELLERAPFDVVGVTFAAAADRGSRF
jgi:hypothetical protein